MSAHPFASSASPSASTSSHNGDGAPGTPLEQQTAQLSISGDTTAAGVSDQHHDLSTDTVTIGSASGSGPPPEDTAGGGAAALGYPGEIEDLLTGAMPGAGGEPQEEAVHFVLLAEFDIDQGSTLAHQYPYPTGTDEHRLAELMLPDGAHLRGEDWTVFYLGQDHQLAIDPMFSHETTADTAPSAINKRASMYDPTMRPRRGAVGGGLLYVLTCVRCKEDKTVKRGAMVKSLAICTPHPWIHVFKPILLLALEEYFRSPSPEVLAHLYDCCNSGQILVMPQLSRAEKILMRQNDRRDLFLERYNAASAAAREMELDAAVSAPGLEGLELSRRGSRSSHLSIPSLAPGRLTPEGRKTNADTHYFDVDVRFRRINVPMKIPLAVFEEEVGDYSLVELISTFSNNHPPFPAPYHAFLHTNGPATHPIILLINAMLAQKRVLVLGTQFPANHVARSVLAVCALATGCGQILRGITESALPYCNLSCYEMLESMTSFVAGVTNPRFVDLPCWDVCCDIETGRITVNKNMRAGPVSRDDAQRRPSAGSGINADEEIMTSAPAGKMSATQKNDCVDNQFMDEINAAIQAHYGEMHVRQRVTDYISRFTRLASYQEFLHHGSTRIGYPAVPFRDGALGTGTVFQDEQRRQREMWANGYRIDAWRKTKSYQLFAKDWAQEARRRRFPMDMQHQIARLRTAQNMSDAEAELIYTSIAQSLESYDQILDFLILLPPHWGGLTPIANGLFHRWPGVREATIDIFMALQAHQLGRQAMASMNYYFRIAFMQAAERRQAMMMQIEVERSEEHLLDEGVDGLGVEDDMRRTVPVS